MIGKHKTDVVVVGAGPIGLFSALHLAKKGIDVQIFDKDWRTAVHSYALALHPHTLHLLSEMGLAQGLIEKGHRIDRVRFMEGESVHAEIDYSGLDGELPFVLVLPQSQLEGSLEEALKEDKIKVHWNHRVENLKIHEDHVSLNIARLEKETLGYPIAHTEWVVAKTWNLECSFVLGADGYHSLVRRKLDLEIPDLGDTQIFSVFEFNTDQEWQNESCVALTPETINVFWPMRSGRCRLGFQVAQEPEDRPDGESLRALAESRLPWFKDLPAEVEWSSAVRFEKRLAERFGRDRAWLAGDSAHLAGPLGAQSMNIGLREACDLTARMAAILKAGASLGTLEEYNSEREREWRELLAGEQGIEPLGEATPWVREHRARIVSCVPASGEDLRRLLRQIGLKLA